MVPGDKVDIEQTVNFPWQNISFLILSFLLGAAGAWLVSRYAYQLGLMDLPNYRSSHHYPTPKGGGIGIVAAFAAVSLFCGISPLFWLPATILALMSLAGDRVDLSAATRLIIQFLAAIVLLFGIWHVSPIFSSFSGSNLFHNVIPAIVFVASAIFLVGTANFYNFMDGINGMAAMTGIVAFGLLAAYAYSNGPGNQWSIVCLCIAAACLGFLPFNCPGARVFMGDVGSVLLGFVYAAMVLVLSDSLKSFLLLSGFLFPFYADELVTMVERIQDKQSLTRPHRRHLYQILANEAGIAHWKISVYYSLAQLLLGLLFWKVSVGGVLWILLAFVSAVIPFILINNFIKKQYIIRF